MSDQICSVHGRTSEPCTCVRWAAGQAARLADSDLDAWIEAQVRAHYADRHEHIRYQVPDSSSWWYVCPYDLMYYPFVPLHERRFDQG